MADEGTRWIRNEALTGAVIATPPECLDDPRLLHAEFVAMQPLGDDWGPSIAVIPEAAVQGAPAAFKEISDWNQQRGSMQIWRTRDSGHFILANYHHRIDESYRVLWVERTASRAAMEDAVDYWVLVWLLDSAQQGKKIGVTGLVGVDMDASVDRVLAKLQRERDTRPGGQ